MTTSEKSQKRRLLRTLLLVLGAVAAIVVLGIAALLVFVKTDAIEARVRDRILPQLSERIGREVTVGPIDVSVLPVPTARLEELRVAGISEQPLLAAESAAGPRRSLEIARLAGQGGAGLEPRSPWRRDQSHPPAERRMGFSPDPRSARAGREAGPRLPGRQSEGLDRSPAYRERRREHHRSERAGRHGGGWPAWDRGDCPPYRSWPAALAPAPRRLAIRDAQPGGKAENRSAARRSRLPRPRQLAEDHGFDECAGRAAGQPAKYAPRQSRRGGDRRQLASRWQNRNT